MASTLCESFGIYAFRTPFRGAKREILSRITDMLALNSCGPPKYAALQHEKPQWNLPGVRPLSCQGWLSHVLSFCRDDRQGGRNIGHAGAAVRVVFGAVAKLARNFSVAVFEYDLPMTRRWGLVAGILCRGGYYGRTQHTRTRLEF